LIFGHGFQTCGTPAAVGAGFMAAMQNQAAFNQVVQSRQAQIAGLSSGEEFTGNRDVGSTLAHLAHKIVALARWFHDRAF
jgi:hypothetical protein